MKTAYISINRALVLQVKVLSFGIMLHIQETIRKDVQNVYDMKRVYYKTLGKIYTHSLTAFLLTDKKIFTLFISFLQIKSALTKGTSPLGTKNIHYFKELPVPFFSPRKLSSGPLIKRTISDMHSIKILLEAPRRGSWLTAGADLVGTRSLTPFP